MVRIAGVAFSGRSACALQRKRDCFYREIKQSKTKKLACWPDRKPRMYLEANQIDGKLSTYYQRENTPMYSKNQRTFIQPPNNTGVHYSKK